MWECAGSQGQNKNGAAGHRGGQTDILMFVHVASLCLLTFVACKASGVSPLHRQRSQDRRA